MINKIIRKIKNSYEIVQMDNPHHVWQPLITTGGDLLPFLVDLYVKYQLFTVPIFIVHIRKNKFYEEVNRGLGLIAVFATCMLSGLAKCISRRN
jgi:hypothetical protein